jgi:tetratricopeptide (TPR) repeat protein
MICKPDLRALLPLLILVALPGLSGCGDAAAVPAATAVKPADPARAQDPGDPAYWVALARSRYRAGEHLAALDATEQALAIGPDHGPALLLRALLVRDAHGFAASLPWFEAAIKADPRNADARAEYAAALGDSGRAQAMLAAVRELAAIAPDDPRVFYLQAVLAARGHDWALSRSLLERSGMAANGVPAAMLLDAVIALEEGNPDSATATLEALSARQPANIRVRE